MSPPWARPFSMKMRFASKPDARTPAMNTPGTLVCIVAGSCCGTPVLSSTVTPAIRSSDRSARYPVIASTKSAGRHSAAPSASDRTITSRGRISTTRDSHRAAMLPSFTRFVISGRTHGLTPRSNSPRKWTMVTRAPTRCSSRAASTALLPPPTTTTLCRQYGCDSVKKWDTCGSSSPGTPRGLGESKYPVANTTRRARTARRRSRRGRVWSRDLDDLIALGADAHVANRRVGEVLQPIEIRPRWGRKVRESAHVAQRLLPPGERLVNRLDALDALHVGRHAVDDFAVQPVADPHRDLAEGVEHVQLGHGEAGEAVHAHRVAHHHRVEPPATARPPRRGPELATQFADPLGQRWLGLGGEGAVPHPRRVCLYHAEHGVDRRGPDPSPHRRAARGRIGRRDIGIGPVVDVQQRALCPLQPDA